jgi:hypothetical protein
MGPIDSMVLGQGQLLPLSLTSHTVAFATSIVELLPKDPRGTAKHDAEPISRVDRAGTYTRPNR